MKNSIQKLQEQQKELLKGIEHPRVGNVIGLFEEVGELSKEIMEMEIYGEDKKEALEDECADLLFSLFSVCDSYDVDLQDAYLRKIEKITDKIPEWREKYGSQLSKLREKMD